MLMKSNPSTLWIQGCVSLGITHERKQSCHGVILLACHRMGGNEKGRAKKARRSPAILPPPAPFHRWFLRRSPSQESVSHDAGKDLALLLLLCFSSSSSSSACGPVAGKQTDAPLSIFLACGLVAYPPILGATVLHLV